MLAYKQVNFNIEKEIRSNLKSIYGIGWFKSTYIAARLGFFYPLYNRSLNFYNFLLLSFVLDFFTWLEVRIKRVIHQNIKKAYDINSYKGLRHKDGLPVRGQRTRTNASTKKRYKIILND